VRRALLLLLALGCVLAVGRRLSAQSQLKQINDELVKIARTIAPSVVAIEFEPPRDRPGAYFRFDPEGRMAVKFGEDGPIVRDRPDDGPKEGGEGAFVLEGKDAERLARSYWAYVMGPAGLLPTHASGVIMSEDGLVLTSFDLRGPKDAVRMKVKLSDGRTFEGKLIGHDSRTRLAVVKIEARDLPSLALAEESPPMGSLVVSAGHAPGVGTNISLGVVSGANRVVTGGGAQPVGSSMQYAGLLQVTVPVNPSDVGGPVVDLDGHLVGVLHSSLTGRPGPPQAPLVDVPGGVRLRGGFYHGSDGLGGGAIQGVSFATPVGVIRRVYGSLKDGKAVAWGYLGIYFTVLEGQGGVVSKIIDDSPAAAAGLKKGDIIRSLAIPGQEALTLTGRPEEVAAFTQRIGWTEPGTEVTLGLIRAGRQEELKVTLGTAPERPHMDAPFFGGGDKMRFDPPKDLPRGRAWLGVVLGAAEGGVRVDGVSPLSPAERHGLQPGDVIIRIDKEKVETPEAVAESIMQHEPGDRIAIALKRGDVEVTAEVELGTQGVPALPRAVVPQRAFVGIEARNTDDGLRITRVLEDSPAGRAGLKTDDIILRAAEKEIAGMTDLKDVLRSLKPDDEITVTVRRGDKEIDVKVTLGAPPALERMRGR